MQIILTTRLLRTTWPMGLWLRLPSEWIRTRWRVHIVLDCCVPWHTHELHWNGHIQDQTLSWWLLPRSWDIEIPSHGICLRRKDGSQWYDISDAETQSGALQSRCVCCSKALAQRSTLCCQLSCNKDELQRLPCPRTPWALGNVRNHHARSDTTLDWGTDDRLHPRQGPSPSSKEWIRCHVCCECPSQEESEHQRIINLKGRCKHGDPALHLLQQVKSEYCEMLEQTSLLLT